MSERLNRVMDLARKARRKSFEVDDYWWKAHTFLKSLNGKTLDSLTPKQRHWYQALKQDLAEVETEAVTR